MSFTPGQQELNNRAMLSIMKYLMSGVKVDGGVQQKFVNAAKQSLGIDTEAFKNVLAEVRALKASGDLQAATMPMGFQRQQSITASAAGAALQKGPAMPAGGLAPKPGSKAAKAAAAAAAAAGGYGMGEIGAAVGGARGAGGAVKKGGSRKDSTAAISGPPAMLGTKVDRFWPDENKWYEAVITDYFPATNLHVLTYLFNSASESFEEVNFSIMDKDWVRVKPERINLLAYQKSPAVQNSQYLKSIMGDNLGGGGGGGKTGGAKKRKNDNSDLGDDEDYYLS